MCGARCAVKRLEWCCGETVRWRRRLIGQRTISLTSDAWVYRVMMMRPLMMTIENDVGIVNLLNRKDRPMPNKVKKVMHEFKAGKLHSGSKTGPKVTKRKQAVAIALSEQRQADKTRRKK